MQHTKIQNHGFLQYTYFIVGTKKIIKLRNEVYTGYIHQESETPGTEITSTQLPTKLFICAFQMLPFVQGLTFLCVCVACRQPYTVSSQLIQCRTLKSMHSASSVCPNIHPHLQVIT